MDAVISERLFKKKQKSSFDMLNRNWVFILLFSDIILSLLITTIIVLLSLWFLLLQLLFWLILLLQLISRNKVGESSKKGIQAAWSTPIHHVKWWISHFRGIYRALPACEAGLFLILLKCIQPLCHKELRVGCCGCSVSVSAFYYYCYYCCCYYCIISIYYFCC